VSTVLAGEVEAVLGAAVAAVRARERQRVRDQRLRAALMCLRKASALLTPVSTEARAQVEAAVAAVERLPSPEKPPDRWAVAKALDAFLAKEASANTLARHLIRLGAGAGTGQVHEVKACMNWVRKERLRCRRAGACPRGFGKER
jgi:hypothetical protein